jgi:hypothetical protein
MQLLLFIIVFSIIPVKVEHISHFRWIIFNEISIFVEKIIKHES